MGFPLQQKMGGNKPRDLWGRPATRNGLPAVFVPLDIGVAIGLAAVHAQTLAPVPHKGQSGLKVKLHQCPMRGTRWNKPMKTLEKNSHTKL